MSKNIKKWIPFATMLSLAVFSFVYFIIAAGEDAYQPLSDDPKTIYREACAECHGERGEGVGVLYPGLADEAYSREKIKQSISEGSWRMPRFKNIKGDTLDLLVQFVFSKSYQIKGRSAGSEMENN